MPSYFVIVECEHCEREFYAEWKGKKPIINSHGVSDIECPCGHKRIYIRKLLDKRSKKQ